jgi:peroxiredoxin
MRPQPSASAEPRLGEKAPGFDLVDGRGARVSLAALRGGPVVLVFLRHLGCPLCRMELATFTRRAGELRAHGASLLVFVESPAASVAAFAEARAGAFHLIADPDRAMYRRYGIERGGLLAYLSPSALGAAIRATARGHLHGRCEGSELQLPGDFVLDAAGRVTYAHRGRHIADHAPFDVLLAQLTASGDRAPPG